MADRIHFCLLAIFLVFAEASRSAIDGKIFPFLFIACHCPMKNFVNSNSLPAGQFCMFLSSAGFFHN